MSARDIVIHDPDALINAEFEDQQPGTPEFEDRVIQTLAEEYEENGLEILVKLVKVGLKHNAAGTQDSHAGRMEMGDCAAGIIDELRMTIARKSYERKVEQFIHGETF